MFFDKNKRISEEEIQENIITIIKEDTSILESLRTNYIGASIINSTKNLRETFHRKITSDTEIIKDFIYDLYEFPKEDIEFIQKLHKYGVKTTAKYVCLQHISYYVMDNSYSHIVFNNTKVCVLSCNEDIQYHRSLILNKKQTERFFLLYNAQEEYKQLVSKMEDLIKLNSIYDCCHRLISENPFLFEYIKGDLANTFSEIKQRAVSDGVNYVLSDVKDEEFLKIAERLYVTDNTNEGHPEIKRNIALGKMTGLIE